MGNTPEMATETHTHTLPLYSVMLLAIATTALTQAVTHDQPWHQNSDYQSRVVRQQPPSMKRTLHAMTNNGHRYK
jgi:hypothetical protein